MEGLWIQLIIFTKMFQKLTVVFLFLIIIYLLLLFKPLQIEIEQVFLKNVLKSIPRFPMVF